MHLRPVRKIRQLIRGAIAVSLMLNSIAHAQQSATPMPSTAPDPGTATEVPQRVEVKAHYANGVGSSDAASQGTVEGARLSDLSLLRPGEVLETVPGLVVTQHSGDGKANQYWLRGYNLDHGTDFASFVDGVPVNMPTNAHGQGYSDLNFLIPELVQEIDYYKGPYFAENGDFSAAGSARIKYISHLDQGIADFTLGGFGYRRVLLADSTSLQSPAANGSAPSLLGAFEAEQTDGPWTTPENLSKFNGLLKLSQGNYALGWSLNMQAYNAHWNSTDQVPLALIQAGQLGLYSALDPTDGGNTSRTLVSGEWHRHDTDSYTRALFFAQHYSLQLWSNFTFYELRPATGDQFEQFERRNILGTQLAQGWKHGLFGNNSTTELGLQLRHDAIRVGLYDTESRTIFQTVSDDQVDDTALGLYVQNKTEWQPWLRSVIGLRFDQIRMNMNSIAIPANSGSASDHRLSPKLALIFGPWQKTELFLDAGAGFHSNDARGVIDRIDSTTGLPASPVPALVGARGKEIGLRSDYIDGLQTSLAFWSLNSDSELVYNADSDIGSTSPNGASTRYGIEWNNHMTLNRYVQIDADLAWTHARFTNNNDNGALGDYIPNAVSQVALLGISLHNLGAWSGGWVTRYIGGYPLSQDGTLTAPSAIVNNLKIQRTFTPNLQLTLDVLNVFNRQYYDIAYEQDYQVAPSSPVVPTGITVHPGEPRQFRLTLHYKL